MPPHVIAVVRPLIDPEAIRCSDGANVYKTFALEAGVAHRPINVQQGIRVLEGVFHIQNVNAYDSPENLDTPGHQVPRALLRLAPPPRVVSAHNFSDLMSQ